MRSSRSLAGLFLLLGLGLNVWASELAVSAQVDKSEVAQNEKLRFAVTIAGSLSQTPKVTLASLKGFQVLSTGQNHQLQVREGKSEQTLVLTYTLAPTSPGKHTLGAVKVEYEGQTYQTQPIEVTVLAAKEQTPKESTPEIIPEGGIIL